MAHKYGIYQSTSTSCIFYKQDEDGKQSTFNLFIAPTTAEEDKKTIFAFIDNEHIQKDNWFGTRGLTVEEIIEALGGLASDAPFVFELEAKKSIGRCLESKMRASESPSETEE